jgi:hypothetical protein
MKIYDCLAIVIMGSIATAMLIATRDLGRTAALFPKIISVTILALIVLYIGVQIYLHFNKSVVKSEGNAVETQMDEKSPGGVPKSGGWYTVIGFIVIYIGLMYLIGFALASLLFMLVLAYIAGYRRMKTLIPVTLAIAVGLVIIGKLFHIKLPTGLLNLL